ncbi:MAG: S8 family serine peptidase [Acidobacteria bacterium]|nr:S8 family serine peptidase [Acidobacteriota bacterium]MYH27983.1 S8 family serine peptidase [Acidobacteriota bacterium]MYK89763.1 S8 family serine peptidase [Acidobacteriota bacterium]
MVGVIDSGIHASHPHIGAVAAGGAGFDRDGHAHDDIVDRLGHGTAVAAAIQDLAPAVHVCPLKVFDRTLDTSVEALVAAIDWAAAHGLPMVNLSLGTRDPSSADALADAVGRARRTGTLVVAAGFHRGVDWLPGTLGLEGVIRVELDWTCARGSHTMTGSPDVRVFRTCGYPRPIPGVDPERNLKGLSFAVANITGIAARVIMEAGPSDFGAVVTELRRRAS